jgi:anhydro-N-acetylmuramic acid kinase
LMPELYIGLMSGTSLDGVDGVLVDFSGAAPTVLQHCYSPFPPALAQALLTLNSSGSDELHRAAVAANTLVHAYAGVVSDLLVKTGVDSSRVAAIGAHGQTVRHRPQEFGTGYTLQLNNPALLAELTCIDVVADFRSRDVAAGGQGAPLVPAFHQAVFGRTGEVVAVLNIGGISNISILNPAPVNASGHGSGKAATSTAGDVIGFDCGPGNALMDHWCRQHTGQAFDAAGSWAASGRVSELLLKILLDEPYFSKPPPKSTGRDLFNVAWLMAKLAALHAATSADPAHHAAAVSPVDVQATLTELTASTCASCVNSYGNKSTSLIVCGGGAFNAHLLQRIKARLPGLRVVSSQDRGLPPMQVEATAFAWLARKTVLRETASLPKVTGAKGARILGAIYPA